MMVAKNLYIVDKSMFCISVDTRAITRNGFTDNIASRHLRISMRRKLY